MSRGFCAAAVGIAVALALTGCIGDVEPPAPTNPVVDGATPRPIPTAGPTSLPTPTASASGAALISVTPYIVFAGEDSDGLSVSASAAVDGILESGGTCTFTFVRSGVSVVATSEARADATYTSCGVVTTPIDQFTPGTWSVTVSYASAAAAGTSERGSLEVS